MKKELYYQQQYGRTNVFKNFVLRQFYILSSYPRLFIEVFIRKNFGERYFALSSALTITVILALLPIWLLYNSTPSFSYLSGTYEGGTGFSWSELFKHYLTWYIYLVLFMHFSLKRNQEIKRNPSVFDFAKFSLYSGDINEGFYNYRLPGGETSRRRVEILLEPAPFFIAGIILWILQQKLGILLTVCSLTYSLGYWGAYIMGDNYVMNLIDQMISNQEMEKTFVDDAEPEKTRGFRFYGRKPADKELRRQMLPHLAEKDESVEVT